MLRAIIEGEGRQGMRMKRAHRQIVHREKKKRTCTQTETERKEKERESRFKN